MKLSEKIEEQLISVVEKNAWHGPALMELLSDIDSNKAHSKPFKHVHSIWEITNHITAWIIAVRRRLEGELVELRDDEDWPPVNDSSEAEWNNTIEWLIKNYTELRKTIFLLEDAQYNELTAGQNYSNYYMTHGLIEHIVYHAGQIAILKK